MADRHPDPNETNEDAVGPPDPPEPGPSDGSESRISRLIHNALANYAGQFATIAVALLLTPILLQGLGPSMYGVWVLVVSIQGLGGLLDLGIAASVVKFVAQHEALGEAGERNRVVSTTFYLHLGIGFATFLVLALFAQGGLPYLNLLPAELAEARSALLVAGAGLMLLLPLSVPGNLLIGLRRYQASNMVNIVQSVGTAVAIVIALSSGAGPTGLILISTIGSVLGYLVKWAYAARLLPDLRVTFGLASWPTLRRVGGYSGWLSVINAGERLFYSADSVLIAAFLPVSAVASYNIGFKPASAVGYLSGPLVSVFVPIASAMNAREEAAAIRRLLVDGTRAATALTLVGSIWLWTFGSQLIELWVGPGHGDSLPVMSIFVGVFLVSSFQNPASSILRGTGEVRIFSLAVLAEYAANVVLSALLIPRIGIAGAAVGTLIPALVNDIVVIPWLACRVLDIEYRAFLARTIPGCAGAAILTLAVLIPLSNALASASLISVTVGGLVTVLLFGCAFALLGLGQGERRVLMAAVRASARRLATGNQPGHDA
jgi:O-antigen/teichoic acid export membrane protein